MLSVDNKLISYKTGETQEVWSSSKQVANETGRIYNSFKYTVSKTVTCKIKTKQQLLLTERKR